MGVQERLSLEAVSADTLIVSEHVHRYRLAARLCAGMRVVDLACGSGYGSAILRESGPAVTGVDNDMATIDMASATVGAEHDVRFEAADALEFLGRDLRADHDAIVCFEGLEHFPDPDAALDHMARHAAAGMAVVVSVPNSKAFDEENEFHVTDYGYEEALAAFERFDEVTILYQFLAEGSLVRGEEPATLTPEFVLPEHGEPEWANHFIACVNLDARVRELRDSAQMQLAVAPLYNRYMRGLERENREFWYENARIARERIGVGDAAAGSAMERQRQLEHRIQALEEQREEQIRALEEQREDQIHVLEQHIRHLEGILATPRHQSVERARDRIRSLPLLDRVTRALGRWAS